MTANTPEGGDPRNDALKSEELANLQPEMAAEGNDTARDEGGPEDVYGPDDRTPPGSVEQAEDAGQQVIGELREREG